MEILTWIIFGLIAGTIANVLDPAPSQGGLLGSIALGIIGAAVGGFIASTVFGVGAAGWNITSFVVAVLGSLLVLFLARTFRRA